MPMKRRDGQRERADQSRRAGQVFWHRRRESADRKGKEAESGRMTEAEKAGERMTAEGSERRSGRASGSSMPSA